jgi:MoaD family protein
MKVKLSIFLPILPEAIGRKELEVNFEGETIHHLIDHLIAQYGQKAKQALYDENERLDPVIQVLLNGEQWITHDQLDRTLQEGDEVVLMMMMAGG